VSALLEDRRGTLWIGTAGGLVAREGASGPFREYAGDPQNPDALGGRQVQAILEDREGRLWFGTTNGLSRFDRASDRFRTWRHDPEDDTTLSASWITALAEDSDGTLWVGTSNGLNAFDPATGAAVRYQHDPDDDRSLVENTVLSIHPDRAGPLWIGTYGGLSRLDRDRGGFEHFRQNPDDPTSLSNNYVYAFREAADGTLWLGTGGGLNHLREDGTFSHFTERDGFPSAVIGGILADEEGRLWLGTHRGLCRFDPATGSIETFGISDGLQSNFFNPGAYCRLRSGELIFGGIHGYHAFDPSRWTRNEHVPPVVLTRFRGAGPASTPWIDLATVSEIELGHRESFFTFEYAALDFREPHRNRYAYRLEGVDHDWVDAGTSSSATYTNVPPGDYTFRVRGSNGDGVWNEAAAFIPVTIVPPFWRTKWFYGAITVAGLLALWLVHQLRVRARIRRFAELEEARTAERELVRRKAAHDFHDEIGHRLTKIGLFSEMARRRAPATVPEVDDYLERIVTESHRLSDDTRDFIWTLGRSGDSLLDVASHLRDFGEELFDRTEVAFEAAGITDALKRVPLTMDTRRHITSIFKEGMNNALRHAHCEHVTLRVRTQAEEFEITLEDDGRGYERPPGRTANGLNNMELRAQKIDGTIRFASRLGNGSTITLTRRA
jgi:signal transduction histidine kinase/streptogramin lyase